MHRIILLLAAAVAPSLCLAGGEQSPIRPNPHLTPGVTLDVPIARLCKPGYATSVRHVSEATKRAVYREYGIAHPKREEYEIDHLVSLELGGSNDAKNLWPESYLTQPWNAHRKDALEDRLHALTCRGQITLAAAQAAIRTDWVSAYRKYVGTAP